VAPRLWPSPQTIAQKRIKPSQEVLKEAVATFREFIQEEWIPPHNLEDYLIALDEEFEVSQGHYCDTVRIRYQVDQYALQMTQTSVSVILVVRDMTVNQVADPEEQRQRGERMIREVLVDGNKVLQQAQWTGPGTSGARGWTVRATPDGKNVPLWWNESVYLGTEGTCLDLAALNKKGRDCARTLARPPLEVPNWF